MTLPPDQDAAFEVLLERVRAGDSEARDELILRLYPRVESLVHQGLSRDLRRGRGWLGARFSTGDVVQDVFRQLLQDLGQFAGKTENALVGYLATSVRHRLLDMLRFHQAARRDGRRTTAEPEEMRGIAKGRRPISDLASAEEIAAFHDVLESFDERERFLLRARLEDETPFQELADQLGYSSMAAARRAFFTAQAQLVVRLKQKTRDA